MSPQSRSEFGHRAYPLASIFPSSLPPPGTGRRTTRAPENTPRPSRHRLPSPASLIPWMPGSPAANPQNSRLRVPIPSRAESLGGRLSPPQHGQPSCRLHTYTHKSTTPAACLLLSGGTSIPSCTAPRTRGSLLRPAPPPSWGAAVSSPSPYHRELVEDPPLMHQRASSGACVLSPRTELSPQPYSVLRATGFVGITSCPAVPSL